MDQLFGRTTGPVSPARARQGAKLFSLLSHFASLPPASCPQSPCGPRQSSCKSPLRLPLANVQLQEKCKGENETDRGKNKKCSCVHIFREPAHHNAAQCRQIVLFTQNEEEQKVNKQINKEVCSK